MKNNCETITDEAVTPDLNTPVLRDNRFDVLKGILIFLVVLGHLLGEYKNNSLILIVWRCIYLFHMPAFIFISGYFYKENSKKSFEQCLMPLFVFQILYELFHIFYYKQISSYTISLTPYWTLWYLLSLFFWRQLYASVKKCKLILFFSLIISILSGISNEIGYSLSVSRTIVFFPFFVLGVKVKEYSLVKQTYNFMEKFLAFCACIFILFIFILKCNFVPDKLLNGSYSYSSMEIHAIRGGGYRCLVFLFSSLLIYSLIIHMPAKKNIISTSFAYLGRNSLIIFLLHGFLVRIIELFPFMKEMLQFNGFIILFIMLIFTILICLITSLPPVVQTYRRFMNWGISKFTKTE